MMPQLCYFKIHQNKYFKFSILSQTPYFNHTHKHNLTPHYFIPQHASTQQEEIVRQAGGYNSPSNGCGATKHGDAIAREHEDSSTQ